MSSIAVKRLPLAGLLVAALLLGGCSSAIWGNLAVLAVTVGIFVGTLALGRAAPTPSAADGSTSSTHR